MTISFKFPVLIIVALTLASCGNPPVENVEIEPPEGELPANLRTLPTIRLGLFTLRKRKSSKNGPVSSSEITFDLEPDTDFVYAYEKFAKQVLAQIPVLGAYESGITLPYRERLFGGDKDGTNKLQVFEYALIRRQIASCVSIEPGFLLYRDGDHIEGVSSFEKIPQLIKEVSLFTDLALYKQVHHKHLSYVRWTEVRRQLGNKDLKFIGLIELEIKYCNNPNNPSEGKTTINNAILRLRP